jgi:hypothetical protein
MLYLLAYNEVVNIGPNELLDIDDYLHFLIALVHNPHILQDNNEENIRKKLSDQLKTYIL